MFKQLLTAFCAVGFMTHAAQASTVTFDFEEFENGEIVSSVSRGGLTASVSALGGKKDLNTATVCDTDLTKAECDDTDLLDPFDGDAGTWASDTVDSPLGNVLIVQENDSFDTTTDTFTPADDAIGGSLTFDFDKKRVQFISATIVDVEKDGALSIYLDGDLISSLNAASDGISADNKFELFLPATDMIGSVLSFRSTTSFAIDNVTVSAVPIPAGLPLLLVGLGGFAVIRKGRRA